MAKAERSLAELYRDDPERADAQAFGRRTDSSRRGFLGGAGLAAMGVVKGDPQALVEREVHTLFYTHGLGHMVGLGVRDASGLAGLAEALGVDAASTGATADDVLQSRVLELARKCGIRRCGRHRRPFGMEHRSGAGAVSRCESCGRRYLPL